MLSAHGHSHAEERPPGSNMLSGLGPSRPEANMDEYSSILGSAEKEDQSSAAAAAAAELGVMFCIGKFPMPLW